MKPESSILIFTKISISCSGIGRVQFLDDIMSLKEDPDFGALAGDDITKKCIIIDRNPKTARITANWIFITPRQSKEFDLQVILSFQND